MLLKKFLLHRKRHSGASCWTAVGSRMQDGPGLFSLGTEVVHVAQVHVWSQTDGAWSPRWWRGCDYSYCTAPEMPHGWSRLLRSWLKVVSIALYFPVWNDLSTFNSMVLLDLTCGIAAFLFLSHLTIGEYQVIITDLYLAFYIQLYKKKGQVHN